MTADRDLQHSFDHFGESVAEYAFSRVREALELERDRHDAEIAELRAALERTAREVTRLFELHAGTQRDVTALHLHSVKVPE